MIVPYVTDEGKAVTQKQADQHNPYSSGLVIVGMAGVIFGLMLLSSMEPRPDEVISPWQILGVALICIGVLAFIALLVAGMLVWQPAARAAAPQATPRAPAGAVPAQRQPATLESATRRSTSREIVIRKTGRAGWYDDPFGHGERFFDGFDWTDRTLSLLPHAAHS